MEESKVLMIASMMTPMNCKDLSNLVTLNTLKVLKILTLRNAVKAPPPLIKTTSTSDKMTIIESKRLILSEKYRFGPKPRIFMDISIAKIIVKLRLNEEKIAIVDASVKRPSKARIIVLISTEMIIALSKSFPLRKIVKCF